jgi:hypothetical protein
MLGRLLGTALVFAMIVALPRLAAADEPVQSASQLFEQGLELIEQQKYQEAAIAFRTAYELAPNYKVLYNVGEAERLVGHYARALEAYTRYLEEGGVEIEEDRAAYVRETIEELRWKVGAIQVECPVDGAVVLIDGRPSGHTPLPSAVSIDAGSHEVAVVDEGRELHRETVDVVGEQVSWVVVKIEEPPVVTLPPAPERSVAPAPDPSASAKATAGSSTSSDGEPERVWTWVAFGAAAATGVTAAITGNFALSRAREIDAQCVENTCPYELHDEADRARALALTADILLGVTAALVITGTVLYFNEGEAEGEPSTSGVELTVGAGSGLLVTGRF